MLIFTKNQLLVLLINLFFKFSYFCSTLYYFIASAAFGFSFVVFFPSSSLRCKIRLCGIFLAVKFPLKIAVAVSWRIWIIVCPLYFLISSLVSWLIHSLFSNMLFNSHVFVHFQIFLWLISSIIVVWFEKICESLFYDLIWRMLQVHLEGMCILLGGYKVLNIFVRSIRSNVSFKVPVTLLIFCLYHVSIQWGCEIDVPYYCITIALLLITLLLAALCSWELPYWLHKYSQLFFKT